MLNDLTRGRQNLRAEALARYESVLSDPKATGGAESGSRADVDTDLA